MAYDPNWPRWVQASVADHFKTTANGSGYVSLVEGLEERTTAFQDSPQRLEIRINGPRIQEQSHNSYYFEVDVNMLIHSHMDGDLDSPYSGTNIAGTMPREPANRYPCSSTGHSPVTTKVKSGVSS